jgi:hypothetical protein
MNLTIEMAAKISEELNHSNENSETKNKCKQHIKSN